MTTARRMKPDHATAPAMRLNRYLARAGVASRRKSDDLIRSGTVAVNGNVVEEPGHSIVDGCDQVAVAGRPVVLPASFEYIAMHKPASCLTTRRDERGRRTVFEYLDGLHPGTVTVGRLDLDTTGLLLLTDDGELAFRLMHPRFKVEKRYEVVVEGVPTGSALKHLRRGIRLEDGMTAPAQVRALRRRRGPGGMETRLELCIREGRKRQVKRMFKALGHPVVELARTRFAGIALDGIEAGRWRRLKPGEVRHLRSLVGLEVTRCDAQEA